MQETYLCLVCGEEYELSRGWRKYCSKSCKNRADKNDRRFGGIREYILQRDWNRCVECGRTKGLSVHHKDFIRWNNNPDNLITLCRSCHGKIEHPNNNRPNGKKIYCCVICNNGFHPIRENQKLCSRKICRAEWKKVQKRAFHVSVACVICGTDFIQKHNRQWCCSLECTRVNNNKKKCENYYSNKEQRLEKQKHYYKQNTEKVKAYVTEWRKRNPEKVAEYYNR